MANDRAPLTSALLAALPAQRQLALGSLPTDEIESQLNELVTSGQVAWPTLRLPPPALVTFIAHNVTRDVDATAADMLHNLRAGDLHLATACAAGDPLALQIFEQLMSTEINIALARMRVTGARLQDVKQLVLQRLFVGTQGGTGKIIEYGGRGDLRRWVRSVAVRTCLNEMRKHKREVPMEDQLIANHALPGEDPRLAYMKQTYAAEFKSSFAVALGKVTAREQTLLRYHHVDGLNIDEIGAIYRVHRVTAFRWLEKAKEQLVTATLVDLKDRLDISPDELNSVLRMIRSQVQLSLVRHLGGPTDRVEDDDNNITEVGADEMEEMT
jgi:RNA polymerase sigma-70 factor, ECF subfamily